MIMFYVIVLYVTKSTRANVYVKIDKILTNYKWEKKQKCLQVPLHTNYAEFKN